LRGQQDYEIVLIFATVVSQTSVKNDVCVLAGYVVPVLQNGALKWKKKVTGIRSRAVTTDHTLTCGLMSQVQYRKFLEKYGWQVLPHPPYSPHMSPPDFDLFPKLKKPLHGNRFRIKTHQQRRRPDRNTRFAQTLDRCDKAKRRLL